MSPADLPETLPLRLADLHAATEVGARVRVPFGASVTLGRARDLLVGAGFGSPRAVPGTTTAHGTLTVSATRLRSLADTVGPGMRLLVCGLNPSLFAADAGVGFARPGNRFWPALAAAGVADVDRNPRVLLERHATGMTDLVKRATPRADELRHDEYLAGLARVRRLVAWLQPGAVCFVGLAGWRAAVDRRATAGWQPEGLAGVPVYVMPSTSGLNAATPLAVLAEHLRCALRT